MAKVGRTEKESTHRATPKSSIHELEQVLILMEKALGIQYLLSIAGESHESSAAHAAFDMLSEAHERLAPLVHSS